MSSRNFHQKKTIHNTGGQIVLSFYQIKAIEFWLETMCTKKKKKFVIGNQWYCLQGI